MTRTLFLIATLTLAPAATLLTTGCASQGTPTAVSTATTPWTDDKGHFRPDWQANINRPASYPKPILSSS